MNSRVTVIKDEVSSTFHGINDLVGKQVLIGIPESSTGRDNGEDGPITNATLLYIHENGSPKANIPARPSLVPGVQQNEERALEQLKKAAQATMRGDPKQADKHLNDAGIIGMNGARQVMTFGDFEPLKPATVRNRHRGRGTKSMRQSEITYGELVDAGMPPAAAQEAAGIQPLIDTAQMRNAITYVVRKK